MASDLYERDYYAWTQEQAAALRARRGGGNALDFDNLAEEVEDLGRSQRRACKSQIENILGHLLKLQFLDLPEDSPHWRVEVRAFRKDLREELSPTLASRFPNELQDIYDTVRDLTASGLARHGVEVAFPDACPYDWADVMGHGVEWMPELEGAAREQ